jgi:hypothetical protein
MCKWVSVCQFYMRALHVVLFGMHSARTADRGGRSLLLPLTCYTSLLGGAAQRSGPSQKHASWPQARSLLHASWLFVCHMRACDTERTAKPKHAPQNVLRAYLDFVFNCTLVLHFTHKFFHTAKACVYGAHSKSCPAHRIRFPFYLQDEVPEFLCTCLKVSNWIAYHADKPVLS